MSRKINLVVMVCLALGFLACKSSKKSTSTNFVDEVKPAEADQATKAAAPVLSDASDVFKDEVKHEAVEEMKEETRTSYIFTVSFFSLGGGSDGKMMNKFKEFIESYNKDKNVVITYELNSWGREGEADFCFRLEELNAKLRADFIAKSRGILAESKLVHVAENSQCHPKRQ
jgi:hypothetical protein